MACLDRYGLHLSTTSDLAAERYQSGVDLLLSSWPGAGETLDQAIETDPHFALAHAARARLHAIRAEGEDARSKIAKAADLVALNGCERERSHVEALKLAINGHSAKALAHTLEHVDRWPRDILILSLPLGAFGLFAFSGMADHDQARVDLCDRQARHFAADDWWFLTYHGWAHGENGNVVMGRSMTERALELRSANANAAHALAHVMYESGAGEDAEALIEGWLPGYDRSGILHGHIAWHAALVALERGDMEKALAIYNERIAPDVTLGVPINVISDTASFLWRLSAYGHSVPAGLWADASNYASRYFPHAGLPFADVHMALVAAANGDEAAVERRVESLDQKIDAGSLAAGPVVPAICRAALAFAQDDYATCVRLLEPIARDVVRIGGSGAQREVVEDTLLVSLMRCGNAAKARALLDRRLRRRPSVRDARWHEQLAAL
jgi:hypothetical protein